jgi:hypothetical protein
MRYEILPRRYTLLIYDDNTPDTVNYSASCQINVNGNRGTIDTLNGKDFYKFLSIHGIEPFEKLGLEEIGAVLTIPHLRLLKKCLPKNVKLEEVGGTFSVGEANDLVWVRLTKEKLNA